MVTASSIITLSTSNQLAPASARSPCRCHVQLTCLLIEMYVTFWHADFQLVSNESFEEIPMLVGYELIGLHVETRVMEIIADIRVYYKMYFLEIKIDFTDWNQREGRISSDILRISRHK